MQAATANPPLDWTGIRVNATHVGIREAARRAGADLPPDEQNRLVERIMKRASREKWLEKVPVRTDHPQALPLSAPVRKPEDLVADTLADDERATKLSLSKAARNMSAQAESAPLEQAADVLSAGKVASLVHKWDQKAQAEGLVNIAFVRMVIQDQPERTADVREI